MLLVAFSGANIHPPIPLDPMVAATKPGTNRLYFPRKDNRAGLKRQVYWPFPYANQA